MITISNVCNGDGSLSGDGLLLFGLVKSRYIGITGRSDYYSLSFRERVFAVYLNEFDRDCECVRCCLAHGGGVGELMDNVCFWVCSMKLGKGGNAYLLELRPRLGYHFSYMVTKSSLAVFFKYDGIDIDNVKDYLKSRCLLFAGQGDYSFIDGYGADNALVSFWKDLDEDMKWQWLRRGCADFKSWCKRNVQTLYNCSQDMILKTTYVLRDGREFAYSEAV